MTPDTRTSLLLRVRDPSDQDAWSEFVDLYTPVIFRLACKKGLQPTDADDLVQTVLVSISKAIEKRPHDHERARFRTWLNRVAENAILNLLTRQKPDAATGGSDFLQLLHQHSASPKDSQLLDQERQTEIFRRSAQQICQEFTELTWQAFWRTAVDGEACDAVAAILDMRVGSVYAARSRVIKRLREKVQSYNL